MSTVEEIKKPQPRSGQWIPVSGYYKYLDHVEKNKDDCFIPSQAKKMLFKHGEIAPRLGSCPHDVVWELIISV